MPTATTTITNTTINESNAAAVRPADGLPSALAYLARVLKTPTTGRCRQELADQANEENWPHEEYLAALLQRQVPDGESSGTMMRIRTAHFPAEDVGGVRPRPPALAAPATCSPT